MTTMDDNALFIDTNILVFANVLETPLHKQALQAITTAQRQKRTLWISRQVIREYLMVMTRPQAFENLSRETVLEQVTQFRERFEVADDTSQVTDQLIRLMDEFEFGGKQVHDANIVASMLAFDVPCVLTHNAKDFRRFGERVTIEEI